MPHPTHQNQMKIAMIAGLALLILFFITSQNPKQNPQAKHVSRACIEGEKCRANSGCGISSDHPSASLGSCVLGTCRCGGSAGGGTSGGGSSNFNFSCPNTGDNATASCSGNSCSITCSASGGGGGGGGSCNGVAPVAGVCSAGTYCCESVSIFGDCRGSCIPSGCGCELRCLSFNTRISTPSGEKVVQDVVVGDLVYSQDEQGQKSIVPVKRVSKVPVVNHHVVHLVLKDGRESWVSASHPLTGNSFMGDLQVGDVYDGSVVMSADLIPYEYNHTYDLLPDSATGYYFANGILMGSTLK